MHQRQTRERIKIRLFIKDIVCEQLCIQKLIKPFTLLPNHYIILIAKPRDCSRQNDIKRKRLTWQTQDSQAMSEKKLV